VSLTVYFNGVTIIPYLTTCEGLNDVCDALNHKDIRHDFSAQQSQMKYTTAVDVKDCSTGFRSTAPH
jgi:hypothetical protein